MGALSDNLARLRVAASTGAVPVDLAQWAVGVITDLAPAAERIEARNVLLRQAATLVSGSRWARTKRLLREIEALGSLQLHTRSADIDGVRELVARALEIAPAPKRRQLLEILASGPSAIDPH